MSKLEILRAARKEFDGLDSITERCRVDAQFRDMVDSVYFSMFGKRVSGCVNCYADAYLRIIQNPTR